MRAYLVDIDGLIDSEYEAPDEAALINKMWKEIRSGDGPLSNPSPPANLSDLGDYIADAFGGEIAFYIEK